MKKIQILIILIILPLQYGCLYLPVEREILVGKMVSIDVIDIDTKKEIKFATVQLVYEDKTQFLVTDDEGNVETDGRTKKYSYTIIVFGSPSYPRPPIMMEIPDKIIIQHEDYEELVEEPFWHAPFIPWYSRTFYLVPRNRKNRSNE